MKRYYVKEKGKYRKIGVHEFPFQPAEGVWIVKEGGQSLICKWDELPAMKNLPTFVELHLLKDKMCNIITKPVAQSASDMVDAIIKLISQEAK